jgi:hypothetical protein
MAKETEAAPVADTDEWDEVTTGLGTEWDFDKDGVLVAIYQGTKEVAIAEEKQQTNEDGSKRTHALAHTFATVSSGELVFVWGSALLDEAFTEIGFDDKVKVEFQGRENFTAGDGKPRQVKRYRVHKAKIN